MRISDWSSDVCSSDLLLVPGPAHAGGQRPGRHELPVDVGERGHAGGGQVVVDRAQEADRHAREREQVVGIRLLVRRHVLAHVVGAEDAVQVAAVVVLQLELLRSEEHTSELQSLMRISYAVFCLKKKIYTYTTQN